MPTVSHSTEFDFSINLSPGGADSRHRPDASSSARWIALPFDGKAVSPSEAVLTLSGYPQPLRLPLTLVNLLAQCDRLLDLPDHARRIAAPDVGQGQPDSRQVAAVQGALQQLAESGALIRGDRLLKRLGAAAPVANDQPAPIRLIFVRTCDRPDSLGRLLPQLVRLLGADQRRRLVIIDDSRSGAAVSQNAELIARQVPAELQCWHLTRPARAALLERVARGAGCEPQVLDWFIHGDEGEPWPSYGSAINLALLLGAGEPIMLLDDDIGLTPYAWPDGDQAALFSDLHGFELKFPEPDRDEQDMFNALACDPIAEHGRFLGISSARLVSRHARPDDQTGGSLLDGMTPQLIHELSDNPAVRLTTNGVLGDPGAANMQWLFWHDASDLAPLLDQADGEQRLYARRIARSTSRPDIARVRGLMTTTMTGIDNRRLLLPTQARGSNEDLLLGALVAFMHPGALQANLPWMLRHKPDEYRRWEISQLAQPRRVTRGSLLAEGIEALGEGRIEADQNRRLELLAEWMREVVERGEKHLRDGARRALLERRAAAAEVVEENKIELSPPQWLAEAMDRVILSNRGVDQADEARLAEMAPATVRFAERYAAGLSDWSAAWAWCRDNPHQGG